VWGLIYPDCRDQTINGGAFLDWGRVASVVRDWYNLPLEGALHRKLRVCIFEVMEIDHEKKETENG